MLGSDEHKVPRKIKTPPPFAFGLDGVQAMILVTNIFILGLTVTKLPGFLGPILGWISVILISFSLWILFRINNTMDKSMVKHVCLYMIRKMRYPKKYSGNPRHNSD